MKANLLAQFVVLFFMHLSCTSFSQITGVKYLLSETETSSAYEVSIQITSGFTQSLQDRIAFNAQVTLLIPMEADFSIIETFNPRDDQDYDSASPIPWDIISTESTDIGEGYNLYVINPNFEALSNTAWYDDMTPGTIVPLFRFEATGTNFCDTPYLIAENNEVEASVANGFTVGGLSQLYMGNSYEGLLSLDVPAMCVGESYQMEFICDGGTWMSSSNSHATITDEGVVTAIKRGTVKFTYTHTDGRSYTSKEYVISASGSTVDDDELCVGEKTFIHSIYVADFVSSNPSVATVDGKEITAISPGEVYFVYDNPFFICPEVTNVMTVRPKPIIMTPPPASLCDGSTFTLQASELGVWTSDNPAAISIDNSGVITAVSEGTSKFRITAINSLCQSEWTDEVMSVVPKLDIYSGDRVCVGSTFSFDVDANSQLIYDETLLAVDSVNSEIIAIAEGSTEIIVYNSACSDSIVQSITIGTELSSNIGDVTLCISDDLQLNPTEGTWTSTPAGIADISETGKLSPLAAGQIVLSFTSAIDNCTYISDDIHATIVDTEVDAGTYETYCNDGTLIQLDGSPSGGVFSGFGVTEGIFESSLPPGSYIVSYTYEDEAGCESTAESLIILEDCSPACESAPSFDDWQYRPFGDYAYYTSEVTDYTFVSSKVRDYDNLIIFNKSSGQLVTISFYPGGYYEGGVFETVDIIPNAEYRLFSIDLNSVSTDNAMLIRSGGDGVSEIDIYEGTFYPSTKLLSVAIASEILLDRVRIIDFDSNGTDDIVFQSSDGTMNILYFDQDDNEDLVTYQLGSTCSYFITESINSSGYDILLSDGSMLIQNSSGELVQSVFESPLACNEEYTLDVENRMVYGVSKVYKLLDDSEYRLVECDAPIQSEQLPFLLPILESGQQSLISPSLSGFNYHLRTSQCSDQLHNSAYVNGVHASKKAAFHMEDVEYHNFIDFGDDGTIYAWINPLNLNTVSGTVFSDLNNNGTKDIGEPPLKNVAVENDYSSHDISVLTDEEGRYSIHILRDNTRFTVTPQEGQWTQEFQVRVVDDIGECKEGVDYAFVPDPSVESEVYLSYTNSITRCNDTTRVTFVIENTGGQPVSNSRLDFTFDNGITYLSSEIPATIDDTMSFNLPPIVPFVPLKFDVYLLMPPFDEDFDTELKFSSEISDANGNLLDLYGTSSTLRCSYDPNDKTQHPNRGGDYPTLVEEELEYMIRFQNNGNDTAFLVRIIDTLDQFIDANTVRLIDASHEVETCIMHSDNTIVFRFDDINLVDSTTNFAGSQGFVSFRCKQKNTSPADVIRNKAEIYFDSNPPIVTNQTINTIVSELCPVRVSSIDTTICEGQSFLDFSETGDYEINIPLEDGCDSIVSLSLEVIAPMYEQDLIVSCTGDTAVHQASGQLIFDDTVLLDTLQGVYGCIISITETTYSFVELMTTAVDTIICEGEQFLGFEVTGTYEVVYATDQCDSIVNLNLTVVTASQSETTVSFCEGNFATHPSTGEIIIESVTIIDTTYGSAGCITSTDFTYYEMIDVQMLAVDTTICEGEDYQGFTSAGTYVVESIDSITGCFIVTSITLDVLPPSDPACTVSATDIQEQNLKIFPNPASELLFLECDQPIREIDILNMAGQHIYSSRKMNLNSSAVNVADLEEGVYLIKVRLDNATLLRKVVVL